MMWDDMRWYDMIWYGTVNQLISVVPMMMIIVIAIICLILTSMCIWKQDIWSNMIYQQNGILTCSTYEKSWNLGATLLLDCPFLNGLVSGTSGSMSLPYVKWNIAAQRNPEGKPLWVWMFIYHIFKRLLGTFHQSPVMSDEWCQTFMLFPWKK